MCNRCGETGHIEYVNILKFRNAIQQISSTAKNVKEKAILKVNVELFKCKDLIKIPLTVSKTPKNMI
jgi:hypothetical protein